MNTIPEDPNDELKANQSTTETCTSTLKTSTSSTTASNNISNGNTSSTHVINSTDDGVNELKIIGHLRNIEKINEKRRLFLSNTTSEYSAIDKRIESTSKIERIDTSEHTFPTLNGDKLNGKAENIGNDAAQIINEKHVEIHREVGKQEYIKSTQNEQNGIDKTNKPIVNPLKTPTTPPPKPPMLSRARSIGAGDHRTSPLLSTSSAPTFTATLTNSTETASSTTMPITASAVATDSPITTTTITSLVVPEPVKVTTIQLKEDTPILRKTERIERPMSVTPEPPNNIADRHYERLVEELKCPGCATPMKAPILLCETGHSVCEQCTRILMMCPLCKEPFTKIRSRTIEALCAKAYFRCSHSNNGCTVRLQLDLLSWHEKQCIYKSMKCFMGRVWGECQWVGREIDWKEHLDSTHANRVFTEDTVDLIWNMGVKQKPLSGYYVFEVFNEMFNFYEVHDKERILFTMACTSSVKEKVNNYAFEVTILHLDNEALGITQKFPVHSEYDNDILRESTCVSISMSDLTKFIDEEKLLHYRVRILQLRTPRKSKVFSSSTTEHPIDYQQTQISGVNLKSVPSDIIVTRKKVDEAGNGVITEDKMEKIRRLCRSESDTESDAEFEAFVARRWGTPQLHFNRKYLHNISETSSASTDNVDYRKTANRYDMQRLQTDDKVSISSNTSTNYRKKMTSTLRRSFRSLKTDIIDLKPFGKKSPEKQQNGIK